MTVRIGPSILQLNLSSREVEKLIKTRKNISKPIPKLWYDTDESDISHVLDQEEDGIPRLKLSHPILRILDSSSPSLHQFNQVHCQLVVLGLLKHSLAASRAIKKLCSSQRTLPHAVRIFDNLESPDAFLCNTIIRGYVNFNNPKKALDFYSNKMVCNCIFQNNYTFPILVKACADLRLLREGQIIHTQVVKRGFEFNLYVRNSLIHLYSVCHQVADARKVFDLSSESDLVTWNTMIDGYIKNGEVSIGRWLFDKMYTRDAVSWNSMISGYVGVGNMEAARELFQRMPFRDLVSWNCMIDGYAREGNKNAARMLFDEMDFRNVISWNIMLALYVRLKDYNECLRLFDKIFDGGNMEPNEATLVSVLTSCAYLGRLDRGEWIHSYIKNHRSIKPDVLLLTALVTMFAKCGAMDMAKEVFDEMSEKNTVSWNSMIMGYGMHGKGEKALEIFLEMEKSGETPNGATFISLLSACTRAGMVLEGWLYFDLMYRVYNIAPKVEHYGCMVDLLSLAGLTKDSEELVRNISVESGPALSRALPSPFRNYSNLELGEIVAKRLIEMEPEDIGPYVLLTNVYAAQGLWDDVENVRLMMKEKEAGSSQIQFFYSKAYLHHGNRSDHRRTIVYSMMMEIGMQIKLSCRQ
ncbi:hypothetical protein M9H77_33031 [Catharanthus roseus]|uniref:Uncharacterized protein n=1 Tax=Catharanthus roseus TaxID=4058 RepID=A0ACC0A6L3_CATRO|nr:hypothetical protein M9H77_33031 [Catharanthus roseus]